MRDVAQHGYHGADRITSDNHGYLPRDNRNHREKQALILEHTAAERGDRVLEVGCGHGLHAPGYASRFEYSGVDLSGSLVARTQDRISDYDRAEAVQMDAHNLAYDAGTFDAVVGTAILHHLPTPRTALTEWCRVTRPGGSVTLMEPNYLFPKAFLSTHLDETERHKRHMAPWRLRKILSDIPGDASLEPRIYALPWPDSALWDWVDGAARHVPGLRWLSQMLLIHVRV